MEAACSHREGLPLQARASFIFLCTWPCCPRPSTKRAPFSSDPLPPTSALAGQLLVPRARFTCAISTLSPETPQRVPCPPCSFHPHKPYLLPQNFGVAPCPFSPLLTLRALCAPLKLLRYPLPSQPPAHPNKLYLLPQTPGAHQVFQSLLTHKLYLLPQLTRAPPSSQPLLTLTVCTCSPKAPGIHPVLSAPAHPDKL